MAQCLKPFFVKQNSDSMLVPCGRCPNCLRRRASAWSFRLMEEEKISTSAHFITLTYDTKHVPISRNGYLSCCKRDLQLFFKRLRKAQGKSSAVPIRYYAVGEYGGQTQRPHYHIILFNAELELIPQAWAKVDRSTGEFNMIGDIHYGDVSVKSVGYTLKYISKPKSKIGRTRNDDREPQFSLMSKGLGETYLGDFIRVDRKKVWIEQSNIVKWHRDDLGNRMYLNLTDGKKCSMPRYYKDKLYTDDERKMIADASRDKFVEDILKQLFKLDAKANIREQHNKKESVHAAYRKQIFFEKQLSKI
ncbi:MAG: replication initiator protein [Microviridae sp.]|nr:MAG: replication initiator protein [Microviridae sp.]